MLRRRVLTIGASVLMLVAGIVIVVAALAGVGISKKNYEIPPPKNSFTELKAATPTPVSTATPEPQPTPTPSDAPVDRVIIPKIKINTGIEVQGLDKNNAMQDPKGYFDIAWYNFSDPAANYSSLPGWGGNAVFAGHVDCAACGPGGTAGPAVFWDLNKLGPDDEINVRLADGTQYTYHVVSMFVVTPRDDGTFDTSVGTIVSIADLIGPTGTESITLITCGGVFNPKTHEYDRRLIVRAERIPQPSAEANQ